MTPNEYQQLAGRTLLTDAPFQLTEDEAMDISMILEEAVVVGKRIDGLKKQWFHNHGKTKEGILSKSTSNDIMLLWNIFGLIGEAAEAADTLLDYLASNPQDRTQQSEEYFKERMTKELGDNLWYNAAMATKCGLTLSDIMEANIAKLRARYPDGFTSEHSNLRLDGEPLYETSERDEVLARIEAENKVKRENPIE